MLKRIPKSDISIRPFKAYKEWSFSSGSTEISLLEANESSSALSGQFAKNSIYGQLRAQFYNGHEDNPFTRTGHKTKSYTTAILSKERFLSGSAKVISIPKIYVGEGIKKGSVTLIDNQNLPTETLYTDDSFGNLQSGNDKIIISKIDIESSSIDFTDVSDYTYAGRLIDETEGGIGDFDIELNTLTISYNGTIYELVMLSMDIETGVVIVENIPFLPEESQGVKVGNVFYNQGLIVLTRDSADKLLHEWQLDYKSTQTIYEHEYLLIVNEDEFNVSTNPSAIVNVGRETERSIGTDGKVKLVVKNPGVNYIRKKSTLENGNELDYRFGSSVSMSVSGGFEHYELSSSVDSTGSFLSPFITTIGLYDDDCQLVAVAKLPQAIKSEPDIPVNFIIRFDT
ncbi:MAG: hypothetical protein F2822_03325 [Actinobacteria bacterium]|nr:hypothetical protein [Actinomycetota bacterium]